MHAFFSVGEPSGDQHAAHLIEELRRRDPSFRCSGFGGPQMEQTGCKIDFQLTDLAVMGVLQVLPLLGRFILLVRRAGRLLRQQRPDVVVLVDFPGFNWWIAWQAKRAGIPVIYYMPPQLWAWASWRIHRVRKHIDHVLCALPFEQEWYQAHGVDSIYVGHPFFDEIAEKQLDEKFLERWKGRSRPTVAILPGSRNQEVTRNWPLMMRVMARLHAKFPEVQFVVACYKESHRRHCTARLITTDAELPVHLFVGKTSEIIESADCALMVSGSVSLEMLARRTPAVVVYCASWSMYHLSRILVRCRFMSLPNLIADRPVLPEFPCVGAADDAVAGMSEQLIGWLADPAVLSRKRAELDVLAGKTVAVGATQRTAETILQCAGRAPLKRAA